MPHKKLVFKPFMSASLLFFVTLSLGGLGFAGWELAEEAQEANVSADVAGASNDPLVLGGFKTISDPIYFDADGANPSKENLEIVVTGTSWHSKDYGDWEAIRPSLSFGNSTYQDIFLDLVNKGYLEVPEFDDLIHEQFSGTVYAAYDKGTSRSKWTNINGNSWTFRISTTFEYGSFFCGMKPAEFFSSEKFNGEKIGSQYTVEERNDIIADFARIESARYVITLRVLTETNANTITFKSNNASAKFAKTETQDDIVYEDVLPGDYVYFPKVSCVSQYFLHYWTGDKAGRTYTFSDSQGKWYLYDDLLSQLGYSEPIDLTIRAGWSYTQSLLYFIWPDSSVRAQYAFPSFNYHIHRSNLWEASSYSELTRNASYSAYNPYVCVGDTVTLYMSPSSNVASYKIYGFEEASDGTVLTRGTTLTVNKTNLNNANGGGWFPRIEVTPAKAVPLTGAYFAPEKLDGEYGYSALYSATVSQGSITVPVKIVTTPANASVASVEYTVYAQRYAQPQQHGIDSGATVYNGSTTSINGDVSFDVDLTFAQYGDWYYWIKGTVTDGFGNSIETSFQTGEKSDGSPLYNRYITVKVSE